MPYKKASPSAAAIEAPKKPKSEATAVIFKLLIHKKKINQFPRYIKLLKLGRTKVMEMKNFDQNKEIASRKVSEILYRFDRKIKLPMPDIMVRRKILDLHFRNKNVDFCTLREEITQSFGFFQDTYSYSNSVFSQIKTEEVLKYTELDKAIIKKHYSN